MTEKVAKKEAYLEKFRNNLIEGVTYYQEMINSVQLDSDDLLLKMKGQFSKIKNEIELLERQVSTSLS